MRLFLGLPLNDEAVAVLEEVQARLEVGRLVPEENLHLTLAFLDEQTEAAADALNEALGALSLPEASLSFEGVDVKGGARPRLAWASVTPTPALEALRTRVRGAVRRAGIELPRERFRPHVTLARFNAREAGDVRLEWWLRDVAGFRAGPFAADRVGLFRSVLMAGGPVYEELASYDLG